MKQKAGMTSHLTLLSAGGDGGAQLVFRMDASGQAMLLEPAQQATPLEVQATLVGTPRQSPGKPTHV